ncbi:MAG: hypothetical protein SGARI_005510 [Bacillariaceae sp.]
MLKGQISYGGRYCTRLQTIPKLQQDAMTQSRFELVQLAAQRQRQSYWMYDDSLQDETFWAFVLTFNVALACHMLAIEIEHLGSTGDSQQAFQMAKQLYALPIKLVQTSRDELCHDDFDPFVFAGILNNISHAHTCLREEQPAFAYRMQLVKTLFSYSDRQINNNTEEASECFQFFMENLDDLVLDPVTSAAAA